MVAQLHRDALACSGAQHQRFNGSLLRAELLLQLRPDGIMRGGLRLCGFGAVKAAEGGQPACRALTACAFAVEHIDQRVGIVDAVALAVSHPGHGRAAVAQQFAHLGDADVEAFHINDLVGCASAGACCYLGFDQFRRRRGGCARHPRDASCNLIAGVGQAAVAPLRWIAIRAQRAPHAVPQLIDR
ncbi:hypothetical protein SDC9_98137 [bioreactor metagenome]|uniref:Uncharacterized protein n=1 Tax=bioreactor metagenome TaxID=1076179 RepID=A0A645ADY5_9ZZZZ